ncbi:MAG: DegT/DnrJ/EryC1/StrS aminotransferase family protein [Chloroflexi bacterium]|nr:DegT/DnrJ/EryC1/StrS aminotransferase family protein [Chloroflexota bacterium]
MSEIHAILGIYQLKRLETSLQRRNEIAKIYEDGLKGNEHLDLIQVPDNVRHSYYKYPIRVSETIDKSKLIAEMRRLYDISLGSSYDPPCHLQPLYQEAHGYHQGMLPVAEETLKQIVALPMFVQMTNKEVEHVIQCLREVLPDCEK